MGQRFGARPGDCPVSEQISGRLLRLPFYSDLTEAEQDQVIQEVMAFVPSNSSTARLVVSAGRS
jgi:dTDP-4-amino-4,6-dideoxygalactose transaminase